MPSTFFTALAATVEWSPTTLGTRHFLLIQVAANELDHSPSSEESLMDGILEDVGLVFQGEGIIHEDPEKELDDSWLEEELLSFCVEPIDEQQALMSLLEEVSPQSTGEAGAGRHSDLSVEVF
ncbi:unnamed protein product [Durusdinium trenchii]|uniref:Uncharacterized protein n=1 Tax=Durusdinium trenchii TaxID=1381693 RepID=A0ABP0NS17_9DINO